MAGARIKEIRQLDNHSFSILWSDARTSTYLLSDLQKACPCAGCVDEVTGKRRIPLEEAPKNLRAIRLENVGRYALKVYFATGCSKGIYHFDYLRKLGGAE